jgi:hypothetical protein
MILYIQIKEQRRNKMGQRTQLAINVKFIDTKGEEHVEREVYHYQWGGYSNYMFESLIPLFINVRSYIFGVLNASHPEYVIEEYETALKGNRYLKPKNWLRKNFINVVSSSKNIETSNFLENKNINQISEEEFYDFALNCQDCNDGRIVVEILISAEKCYCKWNFLKNHGGSILKDLTKDVSEINKYWKFNDPYFKEFKKDFKKIIDFINFSSCVTDGETDIVKAEYDYEFFKKKFEKFEFKELK